MPLRPTHNGRFSKSVGDIPNNSLSIAGRWHAAMDERLYRTWLQPMFTSFENCGMRWELLKGAALLMMSHPEQAIEPLLRDGGSMLKLARRKYVSTDANTRDPILSSSSMHISGCVKWQGDSKGLFLVIWVI